MTYRGRSRQLPIVSQSNTSVVYFSAESASFPLKLQEYRIFFGIATRCTFRLRDHHCVWVGQCIAERNRRTFLMFLVSFSALSTWFAVKMILLHAGDEPLCRQELSGQVCNSGGGGLQAADFTQEENRVLPSCALVVLSCDLHDIVLINHLVFCKGGR